MRIETKAAGYIAEETSILELLILSEHHGVHAYWEVAAGGDRVDDMASSIL